MQMIDGEPRPLHRREMRSSALFLLAMTACSDPAEQPSTTMIGSCDGMLKVEANGAAAHVPMGSPIEWTNNPPTGGDHFPIWGAWDREYAELPRGNYVHNLEHGGIVLLYRCDAGCPDVVAQLLDSARRMPADSACASPVTRRVIVTSDPLLPDGVQVAAVSWNHVFTAGCYDSYVDTFASEHYGQAPEDFCTGGANLGGTLISP